MPSAASPLLDAMLSGLSPDVRIPRYDRGALIPAVVHIGVGGFHRAHQALYFEDLAELGETGWGVIGVGLRSPEMGEVLRDQYGLFVVIERGPDVEQARVVGSVVDYLFAPDGPEAVLDALSAPTTQLVTLTVTGDGYFVGPDGRFDSSDAGVREDLRHPERPATMVGFLAEALRRRRDAGTGPFTVLSCDNLPDSGGAARTAVTSYAALLDPRLAAWIEANVTFPASMVDRITPETSVEIRDEVVERYGLPDRWPVVTEPFRQWVIDDDFCAARPPLDRVGVEFVPDVTPYKLVKARLLNGGHSALGYLGTLAGYDRSDQAMADPAIRRTVTRMLTDEVLPLLPTTTSLDLVDYVETTLERFANPAIGDGLDRLCRRGSTKMPSYLLPSLCEARAQHRPHRHLVIAVAAWLRYLRGTDLAGRGIEVVDPLADRLQRLARKGGDDPRPLLGVRSIFGGIVDDAELVSEIESAMAELAETVMGSLVA